MQNVCTHCGKTYVNQLNHTWLVVCENCNHVVVSTSIPEQLMPPMPDDWSTIRIGTTGKFKNEPFVITGRVRIQTKDDFRNLWCAKYRDESLWLSQSLSHLACFPESFVDFPRELPKINAGDNVEFTDRIIVKCFFVDDCSSICFQGETARFPFEDKNFRMVMAGNKNGNTMIILRDNVGVEKFLWGETVAKHQLALKATNNWPEWETSK